MIKLSYDKTGINVGKLHDSLTLSETFYLTHNDAEFHLMFPDLKEETTEIIDDEAVIDTIKPYKKRVELVEVDEEGNEIIVESWVDFDFESIKSQIEQTIAEHDPAPVPQEPSLEEKLVEQQGVIDDLIQLLADKGVIY